MGEADYWMSLEYRLCREFAGMRERRLQCLSCDGFFPFATLTTSDEYDQASNLSRPNVFRLNVRVSKQTFQSLFGAGTTSSGGAGKESAYDFTALDRIMPHPVYGKMHWVRVLNPSAATFKKVQELLAEAYDMAVRKQARAGHGPAKGDG